MEQLHTIGKLELSHHLPAGEYAPAVREIIARVCNERLVPGLNKLLDTWTDPEETLRIDRIEISLHAKNVDQLEQMLVDEVLKKIKELYNPVSRRADQQLHLEQIPRTKSNFESWIHFLRFGSIPHTTCLPEQKTWEEDVLSMVATDVSAKDACSQVLVNYPQSIARILSQFGKNFIYSLVAAFSGTASKPFTTLVQNWEAVFERKDFRELMYSKSWSLSFLQKQSRQWLIYKIVKQTESQDPAILMEDLAASCFDKLELPVYFLALEEFLVDHKTDWPVLTEAVVSWRRRNVLSQPEKDTLRHEPAINHEDKTEKLAFIEEEAVLVKVKDGVPYEDQSTGILEREREDEAKDQIENSSSDKAGATEKVDEQTVLPKAKDKVPGDDELIEIVERGREDGARDEIESSLSDKGDVIEKIEDGEMLKPLDSVPNAANDKKAMANGSKANEETRPGSPYDEIVSDNTLPEDPYENIEPVLHYINNAGLVLIYPYLQPLFDSQGLLVKNQFKNNLCRNKAVQFLCYLAYGKTGLQEYDLILPKLLCGLFPQYPVNRFVELTDEEKDEANLLLKAVIEHWKVLKNTSPDGLRVNFLLREGRLQWKSSEWRLRVTQQTWDILLERLPWSISIIRLPWMPFFLKTEWT